MSLLEQLRGVIERTYAVASGIREIAPYVIGDRGYRQFYAVTDDRAKTLIREHRGDLHACIYYPDWMIRRLEEHPPQRGLNPLNVDAFATLVEELDHLVLLAWRGRQRRPVRLLELEIQANITKVLVMQRFLASGRKLSDERRHWLYAQLFGRPEFVDRDPEVRQRYRDASRYALRFLERLPRTPQRRLAQLRQFYRLDGMQKLELLA